MDKNSQKIPGRPTDMLADIGQEINKNCRDNEAGFYSANTDCGEACDLFRA